MFEQRITNRRRRRRRLCSHLERDATDGIAAGGLNVKQVHGLALCGLLDALAPLDSPMTLAAAPDPTKSRAAKPTVFCFLAAAVGQVAAACNAFSRNQSIKGPINEPNQCLAPRNSNNSCCTLNVIAPLSASQGRLNHHHHFPTCTDSHNRRSSLACLLFITMASYRN